MCDVEEYNLPSTDDFYTYNDQGDWYNDPFNADVQGPWDYDPFGPDAETWNDISE